MPIKVVQREFLREAERRPCVLLLLEDICGRLTLDRRVSEDSASLAPLPLCDAAFSWLSRRETPTSLASSIVSFFLKDVVYFGYDVCLPRISVGGREPWWRDVLLEVLEPCSKLRLYLTSRVDEVEGHVYRYGFASDRFVMIQRKMG